MENVSRIIIGQTDTTTIAIGDTLKVLLTDGTEVLIELFEREAGLIDISIANRAMRIIPQSGNKIRIGTQGRF